MSLFLTTVVVGMVALVSNAELEPKAFTRNILFLLGAIVGLVGIVYHRHVHLFEAMLFLLYYVVYLIIVVIREIKTANGNEEVLQDGESR